MKGRLKGKGKRRRQKATVDGIDRLEACPPNGKKQRPTAKGKKERRQTGSLPHGSKRGLPTTAEGNGKGIRRTAMTNDGVIHQEVNIWEMVGWIVRGWTSSLRG